jgi:hypothetical protein
MAKLALVAATSRDEYVKYWNEWVGQLGAKGEGAFWLNLIVPRKWREEVQKLAQQGEAEFWLKHGGNIVVKADLLDVRWATSREGISLPEEWKNLWTPDPEKSAPTWLLLRNLQIVDEPYQPPSERQRPTTSVFGVVLLEPLESTEPKEVKPVLLRGLVRDFGYWLQGPKGDLKERKKRIEPYQEKLRDEKAIDALEEQDVRTLLQGLWALRFLGTEEARKAFVDNILRQNGLDRLKEWLKDMVRRGERGLGDRDFDELLRGVNGIGPSILSELLCLRFPDRYWIWNRVTERAAEELRKIGASQFRPVKGTNGQQYFAWKSLLDEIYKALMEIQSQLPDEIREALREMPYFVADSFCNWLVHERKIWRVAPGEGGEWWDECRENGCIVIGWSKAAEKASNYDFRKLSSKEELRELFRQAYRGRRGVGGWSQVWDFVREIQPGDIIVAKRGKNEVIGIGIVTSDCIPPGHPEHPLGNKHEFRHARKVDWRITESVRVNFNLGGQTVVRERRWDDIVKAYQVEGIEVYERLWGSGNSSSPSLVRYFKAKGFQFTEEQVVAFYAALKTKGFVILSGLSGTGKTKLAQLFAELLCPCEKCQKGEGHNVCEKCTHLFLSVRPDWRDSKALLGYYNPLTERYESTPLLEFLLRAAKDYDQNKSNAQPYFIILDEMNLAHVEYYFADFLSVLESGRDEEGWTKESLRLERIGNLPLPPNLYIIGTVNIDETTYMFSPKVLDRAFTLEFREVDFSDYPPERTDKNWTPEQTEELRQNILEDLRNGGKFCAVVASKKEISQALEALKKLKTSGDARDMKEALNNLNRTLQPYDLHFGYRVLDEIALFVQNATQAPDDVVGKLSKSEDEALDYAVDYAVLMKVLPKFHGPRQKLETPLREVLKWAAKDSAPEWVKDTSKPITLEQITGALQKWERLDATQQQTQQEARQGADRQAEQTATAQQEQGNQTEATTTQAAQGEAKGQSEAITAQRFKSHFRYANTAKKVLQMLRQLYETGFASFAQ